MNQFEFQQSKYWDMEIPLKELINISDKCFLDVNYKRHKSDYCFGQFVCYVPYKESHLIIGVDSYGFVYDGDISSVENVKYKEINIVDGLKLLDKYRVFINSKDDFESKLIKIVEESCINIIYDNTYSLENSRRNINIK